MLMDGCKWARGGAVLPFHAFLSGRFLTRCPETPPSQVLLPLCLSCCGCESLCLRAALEKVD